MHVYILPLFVRSVCTSVCVVGGRRVRLSHVCMR